MWLFQRWAQMTIYCEFAQVRDLAPLSVRSGEKAVPILTTDEGIGERRVLDDVQSEINGCAKLTTRS